MKSLQDLFLKELSDIYDAENRIAKALPRMAKAATCHKLQTAIHRHLKETEGHITKVEQVFECFGKKPQAKACKATIGLLEEAEEVAEEFKDSPAINAALIAAAQKVEHYEIATYGCLLEWSDVLGNEAATAILEEILGEEKASNEALTEIAIASSNDEAFGDDEAGNEEESLQTAFAV